jgi:hypothetical protein
MATLMELDKKIHININRNILASLVRPTGAPFRDKVGAVQILTCYFLLIDLVG